MGTEEEDGSTDVVDSGCNSSILYTHTQQETKMDNDEKSEIKAVLGIALLITMAIVGLISEAL